MAFPEDMLKPRTFESKTLCAESPLHPELSQGHVAKKGRRGSTVVLGVGPGKPHLST